jgi:hypothetical protein
LQRVCERHAVKASSSVEEEFLGEFTSSFELRPSLSEELHF